MKKYLLLIGIVAVLTTGCGNTNKVTNNNTNTTQEQNQVDKNSNEYKEHVFFLQKAVSTYAKSIKYSEENCTLTPDGVAECFAKHMSGSSRNGNVINESRGGTWQFIINGNCKNTGECKIIVDNTYEVDLTQDEDGYLTTENPSSPY